MNAQQLGSFLVNPFTTFDPSLFNLNITVVQMTAKSALIAPYSSRRIFLHFVQSPSFIPVVAGTIGIGGAGPESFYASVTTAPFEFTWQSNFIMVQQEVWNVNPNPGSAFNVFEVEWNHPNTKGCQDASRKLEAIASKVKSFVRKEWGGCGNPNANNSRRSA